MTIFLALLRTQWRWCRPVLLPGLFLLAGVPFLVLRGITARMLPVEAMFVVTGWSAIFPALAGLLGLLVAVATWSPDRRGQHVHALILPIRRSRYVLFRYLGGAVLLAPLFAALLLGTLIATRLTPVPVGLHPYPVALTFRFALATLLAFSLFFAILSGTPRTAAMILATFGVLIGVSVLLAIVAPSMGAGNEFFYLLLHGPGPFSLFAGRWMLLDV